MSWLQDLKDSAAKFAGKFKNKESLRASVAASVLIAASDGSIDGEEKAKTLGFVKQDENLRVFDENEVIAVFTEFADKFDFDAGIGKAGCKSAIEGVKGNQEQSEMVCLVSAAIGGADGDFDEAEKATAREICGWLNVSTSTIGV